MKYNSNGFFMQPNKFILCIFRFPLDSQIQAPHSRCRSPAPPSDTHEFLFPPLNFPTVPSQPLNPRTYVVVRRFYSSQPSS